MPLTRIASTPVAGNPRRSLLRAIAGRTEVADIDVIADPAALVQAGASPATVEAIRAACVGGGGVTPTR